VAPTVFLKTFVKGQGIVNTSSVSPAGLGSITDGRSDLHNTTIVFIPFPSNKFRIQLSRSMPISYSCERRILPTLECMLHKQTDLQTPCITFVATVCRRPTCIFVQSNTSLKPSKIVKQWMKQVQPTQTMASQLGHVASTSPSRCRSRSLVALDRCFDCH
jgi:hypothetical protein